MVEQVSLRIGLDATRASSEAGKFVKSVDNITKATKRTGKGLDKFQSDLRDTGNTAKTVGKVVSRVFAVLASGVLIRGIVSKLAAFDVGLVGVGKTADLSGLALTRFGDQIVQLSSDIPVATGTLLDIGGAAGQLGVKGTANILKFTDTVAKLGVASNLQGEDAAKVLARLLNVTGEAVGTVDVLASVIVRLGNNFAATEAEIAHTATSVAQAGAVFGVSSAEAAGFAAAIAALGGTAQLGGSSLGRLLRTLDGLTREGGPQLELLARTAGTTGAALKKAFQENASDGIVTFLTALKNVTATGGSASEFLEKFGLTGEELAKTLPVLAANLGIVTDALSQARDETKNTTALTNESRRAFDSLGATLVQAGNVWDAIILQFRSSTGTIKDIVRGITDLGRGFIGLRTHLPETEARVETLKIAFVALGVAAAATLVKLKGFAIVASIFAGIGTVLAALLSPLGLAVAAFAGIAAGLFALRKALFTINGDVASFGDFFLATFEIIGEKISTFAGRMRALFSLLFQQLREPLKRYAEIFLKTIAALAAPLKALVTRLVDVTKALANIDFSNPLTTVNSLLRASGAIKKAFDLDEIGREIGADLAKTLVTNYTKLVARRFNQARAVLPQIAKGIFDGDLFAEISKRAGERSANNFLDAFKKAALVGAQNIGLLALGINFEAVAQTSSTIDSRALSEASIKAASEAEELNKHLATLRGRAKAAGDSIAVDVTQSLQDFLTGAATFGEGIKSIFNSVRQAIFEATVSEPIKAAVSSFFESVIASLLGANISDPNTPPPGQQKTAGPPVPPGLVPTVVPSALGNVFGGGNLIPFGSGGVISSPVAFPLANGNTGVAGEAGAEGILPLKRNSQGQLGVISQGGGMSVTNNFNITTRDAGSFRKSKRQISNDANKASQRFNG